MKGGKADNKGRSGSRLDRRTAKHLNPPKEGETSGWVHLEMDLIESPAFRALSHAATRILMRLLVEHMAHARQMNGELVCLYSDFEAYGVARGHIKRALAELKASGLVKVRSGEKKGARNAPNRYRLTFYGSVDADSVRPATNDWKGKFSDLAEAKTMMAGVRLKVDGKPKNFPGHSKKTGKIAPAQTDLKVIRGGKANG